MFIKKFALVAFLLFGIVFAFHQTLLQWAFQAYLARAATQSGFVLVYEDLQVKSGQLILQAPHISLGKEKSELKASAVSIAYELHPWERTVVLDIELTAPAIEMFSCKDTLEHIFEKMAPSTWVELHWHMTSKEGQLTLWEDNCAHPFEFKLDHFSKKDRRASYEIAAADDPVSSFSFSQESNQANVIAKNFPLEKWNALLHAFFPASQDWVLTSGVLEGDLSFEISDFFNKTAKGTLFIQNAVIEHKKSGIKANLRQFRLEDFEKIDFQNGTLTFADESLYGIVRGVEGKLSFDKNNQAEFLLEGIWNASGEDSQLHLAANMETNSFEKAFIEIHLNHLNPDHAPTKVCFSAKNFAWDQGNLSFDCRNVRKREFAFAQHLMDNIYPGLCPLRYISGTMDASGNLHFKNKKLASVAVDKVHVKEVFLLIKPWELAVGADRIFGNFSFDLTPLDPQSSLNAAIEVQNGKCALGKVASNPWDFTQIETSLEIREGVMQASSASVQFAGLKGKMDIPGNPSKELLHLTLFGKVSDLKPFMPETMQKGVDVAFADDEVLLDAKVQWAALKNSKKANQKLNVLGEIKINSYLAPFGFMIDRVKPSKSSLQSEVKQQFFNVLSSAAIDYDPGFTIKDGWVSAGNLPLEKFVAPFLFSDNEFELFGRADLEGTFEDSLLTLRYGGHSIQMRNDKLTIDLPVIHKNEACHTFNFASGSNYGYIPLQDASYFDRSTGLLFTDIRAKAVFEGDMIHFKEMEAFSNSLYFSGNSVLNYGSEEIGAYTIGIHADTVEGSFSSLQHFFDHFEKPFFFTKIPIEGVVSAGKNGVDLVFDVKADDYSFSSRIAGSFSDGKWTYPDAHLSLQEFSFEFDFDQKKNTMEFSDIQGMLLLGDPEHVEEYSLHSDNLFFADFSQNATSFDFLVKDAAQEFIRIKGRVVPDAKDEDGALVLFDLENTHMGKLYPKRFELVLSDWSRIEHLDMEIPFTLSDLISDIRQFGLSELSSSYKNAFKSIEDSRGDVALNFGYQADSGIFEFNFQGKDVSMGGVTVEEMGLTGYNRNDRWFIEQLQMDQLTAAAELTQTDTDIKVDFLGVRYEDFLLLGLEGVYLKEEGAFKGKINLLEADFGKFTGFGRLKEAIASLNLEGKIKGNGSFCLSKKEHEKLCFETDLNLALKGAGFEGIHLEDTPSFQLHFTLDEGIRFEGFKTKMAIDGILGSVDLDFRTIDYEFAAEVLKIADLRFGVDASLLPWTSGMLHKHLPRVIDSQMEKQIAELKKQGMLKGSLYLQTSPLEKKVHLSFEDGSYSLFGEERKLKNFIVDSQEGELKISTLCQLHQQPIWVSLRMDPHLPDHGSVLLADALSNEWEHPALVLDWRLDQKAGLVIERAVGYLSGLKLNLKESVKHPTDLYAFRLSGEINLDGNKARPMFSSSIQEIFESLQLGQGYSLQGEFEFGKALSDTGIRFFGMLLGHEIELKGYLFNQLSAQVILEPSSFQLLNCTLADPAGTLHMGNLKADKMKNGSWKMDIPLLTMHEVRPSLLRTKSNPKPLRKPLVIREASLNQMTGIVGDASSFKAEGQLHFINPQKKHLQNTLFAIPSEILTRIGLNLSVLTPVTGTVFFDLKNQHFILKKFKDVYSDGKISKFYLSSSAVPSTVNLDGIADIQVRFRQSTLLLKLAEMFTITVKGHISDPKYSLQRQKYLIKKEEVFSSDQELTQEDIYQYDSQIR